MVSLLRPLPERLASIGVLVLALVWSLAAALTNRSALLAADMPLGSALLITMAGGTFAVAGVWFGAGAVMWAMGRLLGGNARFAAVLLAVSAAAPPLWVAAPAWMLVLGAQQSGLAELVLGLLGTLATIGFVALLLVTLSAVHGFSVRRSCGCIALSTLFCASYLSLL